MQKEIQFKEIFLSNIWEKAFDNNSIIFIKENNNELKEAIVLNTYSCFGENIDKIELLIDGIKENYSISNKSIKYFIKI